MLRPLAVTIVAFVLTATTASAANDPGIQVDPDSPAGTEYGLPVDQAKRVGGSAPTPGAGATAGAAALFGEGVTRLRSESQGAADGRGRSADTSNAGVARKSDSASSGGGVAAATQPAGSALPWLLGSGALVLVLGAAIGVGLRRASGPS